MTSSSTQKPSSSPAPTGKFNFDVFLSFRGEDTRYNFTDHLFKNLKRMGINTFRDDKLERGEEIAQELLGAIEGSRFSIIVFSERYADSKWCLDELTKIMECKREMDQIVLPVFYHVHPSDVRKQTGSFGKAFAKHGTTVDEEKVKRWRAAMTEASSLSGWHVIKDYEYQLKYIEEILEVICKRLGPKQLHIDDDIVGMDSRLEELKSLINSQLHDVRVVGIYGTGGIGKTMIAKFVYNEIQCEFNGASFLENVKESFKKGCQLQLQQKLLHGIMGQNIELSNIDDGINIIKNRLGSKKVLIVIDDMDSREQLDSLVGSRNWFGAGTTIIVTTRDQQLLRYYEADVTYEVKKLNYEEAIQLFSKHAFKQNAPKEDYVKLSNCMVDYDWGLPLALKVLGSSLYGMTIDEWKSASDKLKNNLMKEIYDVLRISFDMLDCSQKKEKTAFVSKILDRCNLYATWNIKVLYDKYLITFSNNMRQMHDLIQQMGWTIVHKECPGEPSKWSRLWDPNDIYDAFFRQKFTLEAFAEMKRVFSKMKKLRLLKVYYSDHHSLPRKENKMCLPKDFEFPSNLRYLHWEGLESLPSNFHAENLIAINLKSSNIKELWDGDKCLAELKFLDLSNSQQLMKIPKFSSMTKLETLNLKSCTSFCNLHSSIGTFHQMKFLTKLNFSGAGIKELPSSIGYLESLEFLDISYCLNFEKFPEIQGNMKCLKTLHLSNTAIKELPGSIGCLEAIQTLYLYNTAIKELPDSIGCLEALQSLYLGNTAIKELPNSIGCLEALQTLYLDNTAIKELPDSIGCLEALQTLSVNGCSNLEKFPEIQRNMRNLRGLFVGRTAIKELPCSIGHLIRLERLDLENCKNLSGLPSSIYGLKCLEELSLNGCSNVEDFSEIMVDMEHLQCLYLRGMVITKLPSSIECLKNLSLLELTNCENLVTLPNSIGNLTCLKFLYVRNCSKLHKLPDNLRSLQHCLKILDLAGCNLMEGAIPNDLWCLSSLVSLDVSENHIRCIPDGIIQLSNLMGLHMNHCPMLEEIPELPSSLREIKAHGCACLETLLSDPTHLFWSYLLNCFKSYTEYLRRNRDLGSSGIQITIPGSSGIPEWIRDKSMGCEVRIELPENWYKDDSFLGFALFFHYVPLDNDDNDNNDDNDYRCELSISFADQPEETLPLGLLPRKCRTYYIGGLIDRGVDEIYKEVGTSDPALHVLYLPEIAIPEKYRSKQWNNFKASLNYSYQCGNNRAFKVKSCGIQLIYAKAQDHHQKRSRHHPTEDHPHHKRSRHS
ncbi:hypothetical protein PVL29_026212 [Vitis rotundifolia]|uniref:ADP-ribosyl cyclase/cyclic ADP-ribose hydrolase n=1 Tax=Vitis rotundifolia TaxID=103349 RepID=A0AA39D6F9_VITRO|nr:hypothetical protein PVL29_026212 [Vitis rotundifolia]